MIHVLVLLTAKDNDLQKLQTYEAQMIPLLQEHGGRLLTAFRPLKNDAVDCADEIHLVEFPTSAAFDAYREDPRVLKNGTTKADAIAKTTVFVSAEFVTYS